MTVEYERARDKEFQNEIDTDGRCRAADWGYRYALLNQPEIKALIESHRRLLAWAELARFKILDVDNLPANLAINKSSDALRDFDALVKRLEEG